MRSRMMLTVAVVGGSLTLAAPALARMHTPLPAGPVPAPGVRVVPRPAVAPAAATPRLWVNGSRGSDAKPDGQSNLCRSYDRPCATIQHAIDVAPTTAAISVAPGNYPETVSVDSKNLAIAGAGHDRTVIDPTSFILNNFEDVSPVVSLANSSDVRLSNVTVDGLAATGGFCPTGISVENAAAHLVGDTVEVTPAQANLCAFGIYSSDDGGASSSVVIRADRVSDYGSSGVECQFVLCAITRSRITGYGPTPLLSQNGVTFYGPEPNSVTDSTISGNTSLGDNYSSDGVVVVDFSAPTISDNRVTSNDDDVVAVFTLVPGSLRIAHNLLTGATAGSRPGSGDGLLAVTAAHADVYGNRITSNAARGVSLDGVTDSTIGGTGHDQANTISRNGAAGVFIGNTDGDSSASAASTGNTLTGNVINANVGDGIDAAGDGQQSANTFSDNRIENNTAVDAVDGSTGSGTAGTANTWTDDACLTSTPGGLCATTR